jgi:hypothetical protein
MITPEEFKERMKAIANTDTGYHGCDIEDNHISGDCLMEETLIELGYGDGVEIFRNMPKWYA